MKPPAQGEYGSRGGRLLAAPIAVLCSAGSLYIAMLVGVQGDVATSDRVVNAGVNLIAALAAQLLPAIGARQAGLLRAGCVVAWVLCFGWTARGQALCILEAQERFGQERANVVALNQSLPTAPARELPAVLNDKADVTGQLARLPAVACSTAACSNRQRLRAEALTERLAALDAEAQLVLAFGQAKQAQAEQQRQATQDVIGMRASAALGVSYTAVTSAMALIVALILEGVGGLCWAIVCKRERAVRGATHFQASMSSETVTQGVTTVMDDREAMRPLVTDAPSPAPIADEEQSRDSAAVAAAKVDAISSGRDSLRTASRRARDFGSDVARVTAAVLDSTITLNVIPVRDFLGCGQSHARKVRDFVVERLNPSPVTKT